MTWPQWCGGVSIYVNGGDLISSSFFVVCVEPRLPDGYSQIFRSNVFWPSGLLDYCSATLCCKILSLPFLGLCPHTSSTLGQSKERKRSNFAIWQHWCGTLAPRTHSPGSRRGVDWPFPPFYDALSLLSAVKLIPGVGFCRESTLLKKCYLFVHICICIKWFLSISST